MDNRFDKLEAKIDKLIERQSELAVATTDNTASLREHMSQTVEVRKQTQILFEGIEAIKKDIESRNEKVEERLRPTEAFIDRIKFLGIVTGAMISVMLGAAAVTEVAKFFFHRS